jgi:hypothetical protein
MAVDNCFKSLDMAVCLDTPRGTLSIIGSGDEWQSDQALGFEGHGLITTTWS